MSILVRTSWKYMDVSGLLSAKACANPDSQYWTKISMSEPMAPKGLIQFGLAVPKKRFKWFLQRSNSNVIQWKANRRKDTKATICCWIVNVFEKWANSGVKMHSDNSETNGNCQETLLHKGKERESTFKLGDLDVRNQSKHLDEKFLSIPSG